MEEELFNEEKKTYEETPKLKKTKQKILYKKEQHITKTTNESKENEKIENTEIIIEKKNRSRNIIKPKNINNNNNNLNNNNNNIKLPLENFNIESVIIIEETISNLIESILYSENIDIYCYSELYNNFIYYDFFNNIEKVFNFNDNNKENKILFSIVILSFKILLISLSISFVIIINSNNINNNNKIKNLLEINFQNFLIFNKILINNLHKENLFNLWMNKIEINILNKSKVRLGKFNNNFIKLLTNNNSKIENLILFLNKENSDKIKKINFISILKNKNYDLLFFQNFLLKTLQNQKKYFFSDLNKIDNKTDFDNEIFYPIKLPFISNNNINSYSLTIVLDLDETLINYRHIDKGNQKGILKLRPCLFEFLDTIQSLNIEIILFTASIKEYADPLIDQIEIKKKYFNYRLYRQHSVIMNNDFIKDLSLIGKKNLKKIIIVDNNEINFMLQKENGILIKSYNGGNNDICLSNLGNIICKIMNRKFDDIRDEIKFFKDEIYERVTLGN